MPKKSDHKLLLVLAGITLFVLLYVLAAWLYPGGNQLDRHAPGFSWKNNYWCNLLGEQAINGMPNRAKPIAIAAMLVLCGSLALFWYLYPKAANLRKGLRLVIQIAGILAMVTGPLLFTSVNHDMITNLSSAFGVIATGGVLINIYQKKWFGLLVFGLLNLLLVGLNNYCYYSEVWIIYLPVVQKITFASFLIWFSSITIKVYRLNEV